MPVDALRRAVLPKVAAASPLLPTGLQMTPEQVRTYLPEPLRPHVETIAAMNHRGATAVFDLRDESWLVALTGRHEDKRWHKWIRGDPPARETIDILAPPGRRASNDRRRTLLEPADGQGPALHGWTTRSAEGVGRHTADVIIGELTIPAVDALMLTRLKTEAATDRVAQVPAPPSRRARDRPTLQAAKHMADLGVHVELTLLEGELDALIEALSRDDQRHTREQLLALFSAPDAATYLNLGMPERAQALWATLDLLLDPLRGLGSST